MTTTTISFIRHGHVHNPDDVYYGRFPRFRLSEMGKRQAHAAQTVLRDQSLGAIFSSPLLRARQTAKIILAPHQTLTLRISQLLIEVYTPFDGCPRSDLAARNWDLYSGVEPHYEQPADVFSRTQRFIAIARRRYSGRRIIAVTHGDIIAFMILWANGKPVTFAHKAELGFLGLPENYPALASISTFTYQTASPDEVPQFEYQQP